MTPSFYIKFGPVYAQIEFDPSLKKVSDIIQYWLSSGLQSEIKNPDIRFVLTEKNKSTTKSKTRLMAGSGWLEEGVAGCWDGRGWESKISRTQNSDIKNLRWECKVKNGIVLSIVKRTPAPLIRLTHQHYFSYTEMLASTFIYRQLIPAIQIALLERGASLIHASAVMHKNESGILISGWGGSGKTSASSYLYLNAPDQWQYMSDDLAIIDSRGNIHFSPIPLNIFPYNTQKFPILEKLITKKMGLIDKIHWKSREHLTGNSSVARRVPPLHKDKAIEKTQLALAIHLQRSTENQPVIRSCTPEELAVTAKNILSYELRHGWPTYLLANAFNTAFSSIIPSPDEIAVAAENTLTKAFNNTKTVSISIPNHYGPNQVSQVISDLAMSTVTK